MQIRAIILASMSKKNGAELPPARLLAHNPAMASRSASAGAQKTARSGARPWTKARETAWRALQDRKKGRRRVDGGRLRAQGCRRSVCMACARGCQWQSWRVNCQVRLGGAPGIRTLNPWIKSPLLCH